MILHFTKMQGAGNDFIVLNTLNQTISLTPELIRALSHRQFGIGADQILIISKPTYPQADFQYRIFNADGTEVEHCGNGARCFAQFIKEEKLTKKNPITVEIKTGLITLECTKNNQVQVDMGHFKFGAKAVNAQLHDLQKAHSKSIDLYIFPLQIPQDTIQFSTIALVRISNPHAVIQVQSIKNYPVHEVAQQIQNSGRFTEGINVGFMQIINPHEIHLRVYERGAGETFSCGTGACAAVLCGIQQKQLISPVCVHTQGGDLIISCDDNKVLLEGPAHTVFKGEINTDILLSQCQKIIRSDHGYD